ncbi:MAG: hypothetical protein COV31_02165 [Candidatus Yanofskybacteria bacterium CG10_big_fil_rev_8_21_14_0_10_46_23]|uniref:dolichyl-phosphate beta-glucosyltransferase n=1 Tax=Candidatus Yanofskybacteria bacterium CG10_big_fil_rev_8_21_14_0_10_46_23 TaxID=1975098 RepID=A0A2H0R3S9_9BACT|nr:MAG: hypothetical protein COV31_02165 [Candidatus Yanofskybacteria bacterium CG10_big_fil_rev_8_21_14_0_10_46_23]
MFLSVIIPAYNEEKRLGGTLEAVDQYLFRQPYDYEVVVVNDGSTDETAKLVRDYAPKIKGLRLINQEVNQGKGWAVRRGILETTGRIKIFMDADNSTTIDHLEKMLPLFEAGYDVVIGSRRTPGAQIVIHQSGLKEFIGRLANFWIKFFAYEDSKDTQAGFKAFTESAGAKVFSRLTLKQWGFDFEALAIAKNLKLKIGEIPIRWVNDPLSRVRPSAYFKTMLEAVQVRWNLTRGVYN